MSTTTQPNTNDRKQQINFILGVGTKTWCPQLIPMVYIAQSYIALHLRTEEYRSYFELITLNWILWSKNLTMRQLKGKVKETPKQKRERREDFMKQKDRVFTIVLPTLGALAALIVAYIYFQSRPSLTL